MNVLTLIDAFNALPLEVEGPSHCSEGRPTPVLYEKTFDFASRGYGAVKLEELPEDVLIPRLSLRKRLARSVLDYEAMRRDDSPVVSGVRGLQSLREEEAHAATRIQASYRRKKAKQEVQQMQQEKQAASKIQARYRGQQAQKEL